MSEQPAEVEVLGVPMAADDVPADDSSESVGWALPRALLTVVRQLEPIDFETAIKDVEDEPLPAEPELKAQAARNRADRAELLRGFLALRETGRGIARRLEDDDAGRTRDE